MGLLATGFSALEVKSDLRMEMSDLKYTCCYVFLASNYLHFYKSQASKNKKSTFFSFLNLSPCTTWEMPVKLLLFPDLQRVVLLGPELPQADDAELLHGRVGRPRDREELAGVARRVHLCAKENRRRRLIE